MTKSLRRPIQEAVDTAIGDLDVSELSYLSSSLAALNACSLVSITDDQGIILYANEQFCELSGYSQAELIGSTHGVPNSECMQEEFYKDLWKTIRRGETWNGEICDRSKNGQLYWVNTSIVPISDCSGNIVQYLCSRHNITRRKKAEQLFLQTRQRLESLLQLSMDWYWEQDDEFRFTLMSDGLLKTGINPAAYIGATRWEGQIDSDSEAWAEHIATLQAHQPFRDFEYRVPDEKNPGSWLWFSVSGEPSHDDNGRFTGYRGVARDITARCNEQNEIWKLANLDSLTGLPNRMCFTTTLVQSVDKAKEPFALVIVNIDHFKAVNDSLGHLAGDELLTAVANRLSKAIRPTDFIARIGGDEFAIIIFGIDSDKDIYFPLDAIMESMDAPIGAHRQSKRSISMGVSIFPADAAQSSDLIKYADIALHRAKFNGRCQYVFFKTELKQKVDRQAALIQEMEEAIVSRTLLLHYQPVVDPKTGKVLSLEALLRWNHPKNGLMVAGQFHEVFENMGISSRIGKIVTDMAVCQAAQWKRDKVEFSKVAINVTAGDFILGDFPNWLSDRLGHYGIGPEHICIEVTEGMFLGHSAEPVLRGLSKLHEMGTEIAFDDFGTGYASLMHLKMPIDRLKIDRSFVTNIESDKTNAAIIRAVVQLGRSLGKEITVEGVETDAQANILHALGCRQFQGYLFSKPLAPCEIEGFIAWFSGSISQTQQLVSTF